jgi:sugar O-acyltransferase (sialic acid O-acetyltransferase NeuD family)
MNHQLKKIAVFGAGGFGLEVAMLIEQINAVKLEWEIIGFFDDGVDEGKIVNGYPVLGGIDRLNNWESELSLSLALGIPSTKKTVFTKIQNNNISYPILIHPSVIMGSKEYVTIGEGSIICAGTIITTNINIGKHVILNLACTVGHESEIGDFSSFMPTCNISGEVKIGESNFWGTGAKVINQVKVGDNVTIGAGAVVTKDIPDDATAVGVPAKVVKSNKSLS